MVARTAVLAVMVLVASHPSSWAQSDPDRFVHPMVSTFEDAPPLTRATTTGPSCRAEERAARIAVERVATAEATLDDHLRDAHRMRKEGRAKWDKRFEQRMDAAEEQFQAALDDAEAELKAAKAAESACVDRAVEEITERRATAATRSLDELRAIRPSERLPEEQRRIDQADAAEADVIAKRRTDRVWMRPVISAAICAYAQARRDAIAEAATERRYAREVGGVIDTKKLYRLQQGVRSIDENVADLRAELRALRSSPASCGDRLVRGLVQCLDDAKGADCSGKLKDHLRLTPSVNW